MLAIPLLFLGSLIGCFGIVTGITSVVMIVHPSKPSRAIGAVSIACVLVATGLLWNIAGPVVRDGILPLMCLVPGVIGVIANRKPRRIQLGHCWNCGYNLTGNVSGKCSECGAPVVAP